MTYQLLTIDNPQERSVLRRVAESVDVTKIKDDLEFQKQVDILVQARVENNGAGIAGPQINWAKRIFTVGSPEGNSRYPHLESHPETVVVNPEIDFLTEETFYSFEKCLSVPGTIALVPRCPLVRVRGYTRYGESISFEIGGLFAGIYQHELDHLNGVLILDRAQSNEKIFNAKNFPTEEYDDFLESIKSLNSKYSRSRKKVIA